MNEKQPFEQRLSDKLQRLPLPDTEASWQQMKTLLDDKMPRGGGFRPYGRWWWAGMIAIVITAVIWFVDEQYKSADKLALAKTEKNDAKKAIAPIVKNEAEHKNNLSSSTLNAEKSSEPAISTSTQKESLHQTPVKEINDNTSTLKNTEPQKNKRSNGEFGNKIEVKNKAFTEKQNVSSTDPTIADRNNTVVKNNSSNTSIAKDNNLKNDEKIAFADGAVTATDSLLILPAAGNNKNKKNVSKPDPDQGISEAITSTTTSSQNYAAGIDKNNAAGKSGNGNALSDVIIETSNPAIVKSGEQHTYDYRTPVTVQTATESSINTEVAIIGSFANHLTGSVRLSPAVLKKASITAAILNDKSRSKKIGGGFSLSKFFKSVSLPYEGENWWAAGIALNSGVTTGSQNRVNYNVNAKQGVALDYIPAPYLQYHVNSNLYLQTEFNFSAPQYTSQLLIAQKTTAIPSTNDNLLQSTYVQKLYYFNWPVSLYYSPIRNLFFNAGVQFSSLQSGLKMVEERKITGGVPSPTDPVYNSAVLKFKDDTIAARLTPNEWRWETGANYYLSRFTIGIKYNASFSNLVKIQPSPMLPANDSRNSAFLLFLRYNLWESRKKGSDKNYTSSLFK